MPLLIRITPLPCLAVILLLYPEAAVAQVEQGSSTPGPSASSPIRENLPPGKHEGDSQISIGFGPKLGLGFTTFIGKDATSGAGEFARKTRLTVGGFANIGVSQWLSIQPEVFYASKGTQVELDSLVTDTFHAKYIELPLLARLQIPLGERVTPYVLAGPTLGILLGFDLEDHEDGSITDRTDLARSTDWGLLAGIGAQYVINRQHAVSIEGRYSQGLFSIDKQDTEDIKNQTIAVIVSYQFSMPLMSSHEPMDSDGDGILDGKDDCPKEAGPLEMRGCPDGEQ